MITATTFPVAPPGLRMRMATGSSRYWNLVFMQFEQVTPDERVALPRPSIDTGMGLERISAVLQGTHDNYETDLFRALISAIEDQTGVEATGQGEGLQPGHCRSPAGNFVPDCRWRAALQ